MQILKPHTQNCNPSKKLIANGVKDVIDTVGGIGVEVRMILSEDDADDEMANWVVENLKFSVKQPVMRIAYLKSVVSILLEGSHNVGFTLQIEAIVTKDELQHLTLLCKSEIDSMGRIAVGVIRLLKLETSVGQSVIDQLSNLGMLSNIVLLSIIQYREKILTPLNFKYCFIRIAVSLHGL